MPVLPFPEELAADLCAQVGVRSWEVVYRGAGRGALGSKLGGSISKFVARDACVAGNPPYLNSRARME